MTGCHSHLFPVIATPTVLWRPLKGAEAAAIPAAGPARAARSRRTPIRMTIIIIIINTTTISLLAN